MSLLNGAIVTGYANLGLSQSAGNVTVTNGGSLVVYGGVLENSTVLDGGIFLLKPGGVVADTEIGAAGSGFMSGGNAYGLVLAGGFLLENGGMAEGTTVGGNGVFSANGGLLSDTTITNAGYLHANGGVTTFTNAAVFVAGGPTLIGAMVTDSGVLATGAYTPATYTSDAIVIDGGATVISATVADGGSFSAVATQANDTTVNSGGTETLDESVDTGAAINAGGKQIVYGGTAFDAKVNSGGLQVLAGGAAEGSTVANGGTLLLSGLSGYFGPQSPGEVTSATVLSGGTLIIGAGGAAYDTDVEAGGTLIVASGANDYFTSGAGTVIAQGYAQTYNDVTLGGYLEVGSGAIAYNTVIDSGGDEYVNGGTIDGTTINGGTLEYWGGSNNGGYAPNHSDAQGGITFTGTGGALILDASIGELFLASLAPPETEIYGFAPGDSIEVNIPYSGYYEYEPWYDPTAALSGGVLDIGGVVNLSFAGDQGDIFTVQPGGAGTEITVACYAAGTHIRTPRGDTAIETLLPGDLVQTLHRGPQPVRWIGERRYAGRFLAGHHRALPIRLRRHAIADDVPSRDLLVSPDHAICEGGVLIPAWRLINGVSITQEAVAAVHYFHLELDRHGVIFAENTPAETFLDTGCRGRFQRGTGMPAGPGAFCLPRIEHGFYLQRIRRRLAARAGLAEPPRPSGRLFGYIDIAGPARIAGWARNEAPADEPVELDVWLNGRRLARILADRDRPDLRAAGFGQGCHGFELPLPPGLVGLVRVCRASDGAALPLTDAARAA